MTLGEPRAGDLPGSTAGPELWDGLTAMRSVWRLRAAEIEKVRELALHLGCPEAIARLLVARGVETEAAAALFLEPALEQLHSPHLLLGMGDAVHRIEQALAGSEPILIYGDYDVDGTTATVLLKTAIDRLRPPGTPSLVSFHVPHRLREGYGIQGGRLAEAAAAGVRLVISVDTGIRAFAAAVEARALGLDLIVTDHHLPDGQTGVPDALAVINPAQPGCRYPYKYLCGAGVAFKLAHALLLRRAVDEAALAHLEQRLLPSFLKLAALATIADAVPLTGENRVIAALGLRALANPVQPGLRALLQVAKLPLDRAPTATEIGFRVGPRINAAGRMDVASDVVDLFLTRDPHRAEELAAKLDRLNEERRATEAEALRSIERQLETQQGDEGSWPPECLVLDDAGWHRGVIGILASRIVDRTGRPALVLSHAEGQAHGSGRSIPGFHLLDALTAVHEAACDRAPAATLFTRFGGHAHAVGFSLPSGDVDLLRSRLRSYGSSRLTGSVLSPALAIDAEIAPGQLTGDLWQWVLRCAPFGNGNPEPVLVTRNLRLLKAPRLLKEKHVCLEFGSPELPGSLRALGWSRAISWPAVVQRLELSAGDLLDAAYRLRWNAGGSSFQPQPSLELELLALQRSAQVGPQAGSTSQHIPAPFA